MTEYADAARVRNHVADVLNAIQTWGGPLKTAIRFEESFDQYRIEAGIEVLRALASNPENGLWGDYATLVTATHNEQLIYDGEPGIPLIVPFSGATAREGIPADPDEIESWRNDTLGLYTRGLNNVAVAHDASDANGMPSPVSCRYSIFASRFKFTGYSAQVPLFKITREMADEKIQLSHEPALVKLMIPKYVKPGDNIAMIAGMYGTLGQQDLIAVQGGAVKLNPVPWPSTLAAQKQF